MDTQTDNAEYTEESARIQERDAESLQRFLRLYPVIYIPLSTLCALAMVCSSPMLHHLMQEFSRQISTMGRASSTAITKLYPVLSIAQGCGLLLGSVIVCFGLIFACGGGKTPPMPTEECSVLFSRAKKLVLIFGTLVLLSAIYSVYTSRFVFNDDNLYTTRFRAYEQSLQPFVEQLNEATVHDGGVRQKLDVPVLVFKAKEMLDSDSPRPSRSLWIPRIGPPRVPKNKAEVMGLDRDGCSYPDMSLSWDGWEKYYFGEEGVREYAGEKITQTLPPAHKPNAYLLLVCTKHECGRVNVIGGSVPEYRYSVTAYAIRASDNAIVGISLPVWGKKADTRAGFGDHIVSSFEGDLPEDTEIQKALDAMINQSPTDENK